VIPNAARDIAAGSLTWLTCVALGLSSSALIFNGPLARLVPYGLTAALIAYTAATLVVALFGSFRFGIAGPDSPSSAVVGTMVGAVGLEVAHEGYAVLVPTVMAAIAITGVVLGAWLITAGALRWSRWARSIPYPVTAGFLATAGWFACSGGIGVVTGYGLTYANLRYFDSPERLERLGVTLAWTAIMIGVQRRWRSPFALPALLAAGIAAFYAALLVFHVPVQVARDNAWLFSTPAHTLWWFPWGKDALAHVDGGAILSHALDILAVLVIVTICLLSYESGIELESKQEPDIDREMRINGVAVLASAGFGGIIAYFSLGRTSMSYRLGGRGRLSGLTVVVLNLALLAAGTGVVAYVPEFIAGGLVLQTGIPLLWSWVAGTRRKLSAPDYAAIIAIWQINVWFGFVFGFIAGLIICCMTFAMRYANVSPVKIVRSGRTIRSHLERSANELAILSLEGDQIAVFVLQGYLFFGTFDRLYQITKAARSENGLPPRYLVLDFRLVTGIDASAISTFAKMRRAAASAGTTLVLSRMPPSVERLWFADPAGSSESVASFADLDRALEWCEGELIARAQRSAPTAETLAGWLARELEHPEDAARIAPYLASRVLAKGEVLCSQGDPADTIFYVKRGRIGVFAGAEGARRLRSLGTETVVGEMGLYRESPRSATLVAEEETEIDELSRATLTRIEAEAPDIAIALHRAIIRLISDRLAFENELVSLLDQ
jgi:SulP family sulfate permease